jgi:hypothetical protein
MNRKISITNISTKGKNGIGGSYPLVKIQSQHKIAFVIAKESARKYLYLNHFPTNHKIVNCDSFNLVVICEDEEWLKFLTQKTEENKLILNSLFHQDYSYLKFDSEWVVSFPKLLENSRIFSYVGQDNLIYDTPESLENTLKILCQFSSSLKI